MLWKITDVQKETLPTEPLFLHKLIINTAPASLSEASLIMTDYEVKGKDYMTQDKRKRKKEIEREIKAGSYPPPPKSSTELKKNY